MNMECKVVCYIGLLTLCCSHANVHVDHSTGVGFKHPRVGFNLLFHADLPVGIDLGQPPNNALHSWCFFYSCPAIFEMPLYLIIDRTSDSCAVIYVDVCMRTTQSQ
jgi:hypothetical protein